MSRYSVRPLCVTMHIIKISKILDLVLPIKHQIKGNILSLYENIFIKNICLLMLQYGVKVPLSRNMSEHPVDQGNKIKTYN